MLLNVTETSIAWLVDHQPCRPFPAFKGVPKDGYEVFRLERWERVPFKRARPVGDPDALQVRELFPQRHWLVSTRLQNLH